MVLTAAKSRSRLLGGSTLGPDLDSASWQPAPGRQVPDHLMQRCMVHGTAWSADNHLAAWTQGLGVLGTSEVGATAVRHIADVAKVQIDGYGSITSAFSAVAWAPDGRAIALAELGRHGGSNIALVNLADRRRPVAVQLRESAYISQLLWSHDGSKLVCCHTTGAATAYSTATIFDFSS